MNHDEKGDYINLLDIKDLDMVVEHVASILLNGEVVLIPTDTVYGLICIPESTKAVETIFEMKQRPINHRLPIIVSSQEQAINELPVKWNNIAQSLANEFWPGALTIACGIQKNNIKWLTGRDEAAIRVPDNYVVQALAKKLGPLFMTSANQHGFETSESLDGALKSLAIRPALALDGGILSGAPSTLVNTNCSKPVIERVGLIPESEIVRFFL